MRERKREREKEGEREGEKEKEGRYPCCKLSLVSSSVLKSCSIANCVLALSSVG